jgi:hypothetical protein
VVVALVNEYDVHVTLSKTLGCADACETPSEDENAGTRAVAAVIAHRSAR